MNREQEAKRSAGRDADMTGRGLWGCGLLMRLPCLNGCGSGCGGSGRKSDEVSGRGGVEEAEEAASDR